MCVQIACKGRAFQEAACGCAGLWERAKPATGRRNNSLEEAKGSLILVDVDQRLTNPRASHLSCLANPRISQMMHAQRKHPLIGHADESK